MFVRTKKSSSWKNKIQIVETVRFNWKVKQKIVRHVWIAQNDFEEKKLRELAEYIIASIAEERTPKLIRPEDLASIAVESKNHINENQKEMVNIRNLKEEQRFIIWIHEIFWKLYDQIWFNKALTDPARNISSSRILKDLVMARIANPNSKRASAMMLERDFWIETNLDYVYKVMNKIDDEVIKKIKNISYNTAKTLLQEKIDVMFYDCTTLYFESFEEDDLKSKWFSKDWKFNQAQVVLALMVTKEWLPVWYKLFEWSKYEWHTLIPTLKEIKEEYDLDKIVFVADSWLFNKDNLEDLEKNWFDYIVWARLKNLTKKLQLDIINSFWDDEYVAEKRQNIKDSSKENTTEMQVELPDELSNEIYNEELDEDSAENTLDTYLSSNISKPIIKEFSYKQSKRLVIDFIEKRAKKDYYDRQKNIERLIEKSKKNKDIKDLISNFWYKKYIKVIDSKNAKIEIDEDRIQEDAKWDWLHWIITNVQNLTWEELLSQYRNLWQIEEWFRVNKHDLKIRPIYHWKKEKIHAHIAIAYMAFVCVKTLEYRIKYQYKKMSPRLIINELNHIQSSLLIDKSTLKKYILPSKASVEAKKIYKIMWVTYRSTCYPIAKV